MSDAIAKIADLSHTLGHWATVTSVRRSCSCASFARLDILILHMDEGGGTKRAGRVRWQYESTSASADTDENLTGRGRANSPIDMLPR